MLPVRRRGPRLALRRPWSGAQAAMQLASVPISNGGVLARPPTPGLCPASAPRPVGPEPGLKPRLNQRLEVSFG